MDKTVSMILMWRYNSHQEGIYSVREFSNLAGVNKFLQTLDPDKVVEMKLISGITLEDRKKS